MGDMPIGTVRKIEEDYAVVTIERQDMCGECHACEVLGEVKKCEIRCRNICKAGINDKVEIDLSNESFLKATFLMYGIPLAGLLIGLLLGTMIPDTVGIYAKEVGTIIGGLVGMVLGFLWIKKRDEKKHYTTLLPQIKRIIK